MPRQADRIVGHLFDIDDPLRPSYQWQIPPRKRRQVGRISSMDRKRTPSDQSRKVRASSLTVGSTNEEQPMLMTASTNGRTSLIDKSVDHLAGSIEEMDEAEDEELQPTAIELIQQANVDGVRHLSSGGWLNRSVWAILIAIFVVLASVQVLTQVKMYIETPVSTNIKADYPERIIFPTVAICNNNQYRLSYITGARIQNRQPMPTDEITPLNSNSGVFDKALYNSWDMDAVRFLRNAAHWKSRMILKCTYPNGRSCRLSDFKAVWTLTGLCWAINTDASKPVYATRSGPAQSLRLLLNIEKYERIESCTDKFRSVNLPGLNVLIYNQTDIPVSNQDGVNVPPGFTMNIPFRVQVLLDISEWTNDPERYEETSELADVYGQKFDDLNDLMNTVVKSLHNVWALYKAETYAPQLGTDLHLFDRILSLVDRYEAGQLTRKAWAERMHTRVVRNFVNQELMEVWYNPTLDDLDDKLSREIGDLELTDLPILQNVGNNRTAAQLASIRLLGDSDEQNVHMLLTFVDSLHECTENDLKNFTNRLLARFKQMVAELKASYTELFERELPAYRENFKYNEKFIKDNFAMVNVYFHKLSTEHWVQDSTYSLWSLACDIGGALGLFLGASLLTIIELIYLCCQYGFFKRCKFWEWTFVTKRKRKKSSKQKNADTESMVVNV